MKTIDGSSYSLCVALVFIMTLCFGLFLVFQKTNKTKHNVVRAISVILKICVSATSILYIVIINKVGDSIDGEGLLTLLFVPYSYLIMVAMVVLSLLLLAMTDKVMTRKDKRTSIIIILILTVLCGWMLLLILVEETLIGIIVLSAKIVTSGTAIYCIVNYPNALENNGKKNIFSLFENKE